MVWLELVPAELKAIGVDEVGTVKVPVPAEVKVMGLPLLASFSESASMMCVASTLMT